MKVRVFSLATPPFKGPKEPWVIHAMHDEETACFKDGTTVRTYCGRTLKKVYRETGKLVEAADFSHESKRDIYSIVFGQYYWCDIKLCDRCVAKVAQEVEAGEMLAEPAEPTVEEMLAFIAWRDTLREVCECEEWRRRDQDHLSAEGLKVAKREERLAQQELVSVVRRAAGPTKREEASR